MHRLWQGGRTATPAQSPARQPEGGTPIHEPEVAPELNEELLQLMEQGAVQIQFSWKFAVRGSCRFAGAAHRECAYGRTCAPRGWARRTVTVLTTSITRVQPIE